MLKTVTLALTVSLLFALCLEREQVHERGLGAFDLGREHRFFTDEGIDEPVERRDHLSRQLETGERLFGGAYALGEGGVDDDRRFRRREGVRNERRDLLSACAGPLVSACGSPGHLASL